MTMTGASTTVLAADDSAVACFAGIFGLVIWLVVMAAVVVIDIIIIKWIKKDATARGMANADSIKWLGLLNWLGLVIYILQRPK
jgi:hypothetical protein